MAQLTGGDDGVVVTGDERLEAVALDISGVSCCGCGRSRRTTSGVPEVLLSGGEQALG